jgi:hypothetical protein
MPAQRAPPGPPPSAPICPAGTDVCTQADGSAKRPPTLTGIQARPPERALTRGGCRLGRPAARDSTMPPMTGPSITTARSSYSPRPARSSGSGSNPGSPGQPTSRCAPRTWTNGGGCPATPASRTGPLPKPRSMPRSPWPPLPQLPAWARTAGPGPTLPEPSSAADSPGEGPSPAGRASAV